MPFTVRLTRDGQQRTLEESVVLEAASQVRGTLTGANRFWEGGRREKLYNLIVRLYVSCLFKGIQSFKEKFD